MAAGVVRRPPPPVQLVTVPLTGAQPSRVTSAISPADCGVPSCASTIQWGSAFWEQMYVQAGMAGCACGRQWFCGGETWVELAAGCLHRGLAATVLVLRCILRAACHPLPLLPTSCVFVCEWALAAQCGVSLGRGSPFSPGIPTQHCPCKHLDWLGAPPSPPPLPRRQ